MHYIKPFVLLTDVLLNNFLVHSSMSFFIIISCLVAILSHLATLTKSDYLSQWNNLECNSVLQDIPNTCTVSLEEGSHHLQSSFSQVLGRVGYGSQHRWKSLRCHLSIPHHMSYQGLGNLVLQCLLQWLFIKTRDGLCSVCGPWKSHKIIWSDPAKAIAGRTQNSVHL